MQANQDLSTGEQFDFSRAVLSWFRQHGRRDLPWQQRQTPYRVWVSEIMLQQTQVNTVIPYFERFMERFPTVAMLAKASADEVLHHWTGLGYYARARNLHQTARIVHEQLAGRFPQALERLLALPGIGRSTAGAILSLGHKRRASILDGNVKRVLCRYHCIAGWPERASVRRKLWELADSHTPERDAASYNQAIMDLGATICTRGKPKCQLCPLQRNCQACLSDQTELFPARKPTRALPQRTVTMLLIHRSEDAKVLLEKRSPQGVWGGLWSFPEVAPPKDPLAFLESHGLSSRQQEQWPPLRHTFSHFQLEIRPLLLSLEREPAAIMENERWHWYDLKRPVALGLAAPVKKLLERLEKAL